MWTNSTIIRMSDEEAAKAAAYGKNPYVPYDDGEIDRYGDQPAPFPNLGSYKPPGWEPLQDAKGRRHFLVDKTGLDDSGPALGLDGLKRELKKTEAEAREAGHVYGYAIVEEGAFQVCIGIFRKTGETPVEGPDEEAISALQYAKQLEIIDDRLACYVDAAYTAAPEEEGAEPWTVRVYKWLFEHAQMALELDTHGEYIPGLTLRLVLPALIELDLLEEDSQLILRDLDLDGHRLQMWDTETPHLAGMPQTAIAYRLTDPDGNVIFLDTDFGANRIDDDDTVRSLMHFLTLTKGDVDDEYFENYTEEQKEWRDEYAEDLSMHGVDLNDFEVDDFEEDVPMYKVDEEMTRYKPWEK